MAIGLSKPAFRQFVLLCTGYFLFSCSFNMPIPSLPAYLAGLGGERYLGLIISLFTLAAGLSRPLSGKLADTIGRKPVMLFGSLVCVLAGLLYPVLGTVSGFLWLRFFHGLSTGFNPTGSSATAVDLLPFATRGQGLGFFGVCSTLGLASGPALGSYLTLRLGMQAMFYASAVSGVLSMAVILLVKETLSPKVPFRPQQLGIRPGMLLEKRAIPPALVTLLLYGSYGAALTLVPAVSLEAGLVNTGIFFTCYTAGSVLVRVIAGKAPDIYGRKPVLKTASGLMGAAMLMIACWHSAAGLLSAAALYGVSMGLMVPASTAWTVDVALDGQRGKALSTTLIAMEAGIGIGALVSGWWYNHAGHQTSPVFLGMAALALVALIYLRFAPYHGIREEATSLGREAG